MPYADVASSTEDYARRFSGSVGAWLLERQSQLLRALLARVVSPPSVPYSLVDVGGGHGQIVRAFAQARQPSLTVLGSDSSCSQRITDLINENRVRFESGDLLHAPLADRSYEVVTCIRLLPHIDEWKALIGELCRISKDAVIVDYPPRASSNIFYPLLFALKSKLEGNTRTFTLFSHREIDEAFAAHGFTLAAREGQFFFPLVLHRILKSTFISNFLETPARWLGLHRFLGNPVLALYRRSGSI
jgi:ubiquinone/menaquinone biosynthesis C-methylase UbiE